jgi:hypothetical protein
MEYLLSSPEQEAQTSANPLFWTLPLLCGEVATVESREPESAFGCQGLLVSPSGWESVSYRNGLDNRESEEATHENAH